MTGGPPTSDAQPTEESPVLTVHRGLRPEIVAHVLTVVEEALEQHGARRIRVATEHREITVVATFPPQPR